MSEEIDFAMRYTEERKRRQKLETRLLAMQAESIALCGAVDKIMDYVTQGKVAVGELAEHTAKICDYQTDVEVQASLNIADPPWVDMPQAFFDEADEAHTKQSHDEIEAVYSKYLFPAYECAVKETRAELRTKGPERNVLTPEQQRAQARMQLTEKLMKLNAQDFESFARKV